MNAPEQPTVPRLVDTFTAGRMPLWLAGIFGFGGSMGATWILGSILAQGSWVTAAVFVLVAMAPALVVPFVARYKRRSFKWWAIFGATSLIFSVYFLMTFLPLALVVMLGFSARSAVKIPEETLEAEEDPEAMQALLDIREDVGRLHARVESLYLARDYTAVVGARDDLESISPRLAAVEAQVSERGGRVRLHTNAGVMQMLQVTDAADYVASSVADDASLGRVAQGDDTKLKSKPEKALHKQVREIEILLDKSRIQVGVAKGLLEALGFEPPKQVARPWMPPQAVLPPPTLPPSMPVAPSSVDKRRPQRSQRRSRF
jgi:hypothetical protein